MNPDNTLRPVLAAGWKPNTNGDVWTFQIRQGVKFSNGAPLSADDVVATFTAWCQHCIVEAGSGCTGKARFPPRARRLPLGAKSP